MDVKQRITYRFRAQRVASKYRRLIKAREEMTLTEAKQVLGLAVDANASEDAVRKAQRVKFFAIKDGDQDKVVELNVAADILLGKRQPKYEGPSYSGPGNADVGYAPPPEPPPPAVEVGWDDARQKAHIPADVTWLFFTESQSSGYSSDEFTNRASGYVAVGTTDSAWVFVAIEHYDREDHIIGSRRPKQDVYWMETVKMPKPDKPTAQFVVGGIERAWKQFPNLEKRFNFKIKLLPEGWDFKDFKKNLHLHLKARSTTVKNWLVDSGQLAETDLKAPRKMNVEIEYASSFDMKPGFYQLEKWSSKLGKLTLVINGKDHELSEQDGKKLAEFRIGGKRFMNRVFGEYYYGGEKKSLSKNRDGKPIMTWMAENLGLPEWCKEGLRAAAK